jgi:hypothetical protein
MIGSDGGACLILGEIGDVGEVTRFIAHHKLPTMVQLSSPGSANTESPLARGLDPLVLFTDPPRLRSMQ